MPKIGINGFGRIGRMLLRRSFNRPGFEVVGINDIANPAILATLLQFDSVHGRCPHPVAVQVNTLSVGELNIPFFQQKNPADLPWGDLGVDIVLESTGLFRTREAISRHLSAGAKKVLLSVPSKNPSDVDATIVMGVNHKNLTTEMRLISNASCTTNCLAPVAKVLHDRFGIASGLMTTVHGYTNDQNLVDAPHKDHRRARAAAVNIIPTSTGAAKAIGLVIPALDGKLNGFALRVPIPNGSLVDLTATLSQTVTVEQINEAMREAAAGSMRGILQYTEDPLVSQDIIGNTHSSIYDAKLTMVIGGNQVKVICWYDNELGYAERCLDLMQLMAA